MRLFGFLATVSERTPLVLANDQARIEATIDEQMAVCTQDQAARLVAQLIAANPHFQNQKRTAEEERDYKIYVLKLAQAFMEIPFVVGQQAVHGGKGIPSKVAFKPQPTDVLSFAKASIERLQNVKIMMARHGKERERRDAEKVEEAKFVRTPERQAEIQAKIAELRNHRNVDGFVLAQDKQAGRL